MNLVSFSSSEVSYLAQMPGLGYIEDAREDEAVYGWSTSQDWNRWGF